MDISTTNQQPVHWLSRLLNPTSVALVGASQRAGSIGNKMFSLLCHCGYKGAIYPINPRYDFIDNHRCFASLAALPEVPDLVVFGIAGRSLEQVFDEAIAMGIGGAVIFANNYLPEDSSPPLLERLKQKAARAGIPVCGGNGMGFYNYDASVMISFDYPPSRPAGHIALIAHSGSVMTYLANNDARYTYNLVVSPGQEIHGTVADYMAYALQQATTRVIALFIEAVRDVNGFIRALKEAHERDIPVVIAKVGRTEKSARFAASHSGAVAGNDEAFQAVCERYGVIRVRDIDELAATALVLSQARRPTQGGLASLFDSGGLREQFIDLADELNVPFAQISQMTRQRLANSLEFGLEPDNPVDAMGALNADLKTTFNSCLRALHDDPDSAIVTLEFEFRDQFCHYPILFEVAKQIWAESEKPFWLINSTVSAVNRQKAAELTHAGIPVINGADLALRAARNVLWHRDHQPPLLSQPPLAKPALISHWRDRLAQSSAIDEAMALSMLSDFGLPSVPFMITQTLQTTLSAAEELGYPVVIKTAQPHIQHKSDVSGVKLSLSTPSAVQEAYLDLSKRLGPRVLVAKMMTSGVELAFGMINDPQFGPLVVVSAGGIYVEILDDHCFALAPFDEAYALHLIQRLKIHALLQGKRGNPPARLDLAALALSRFSALVDALSDKIITMDLNPVIVGQNECTIVDALVVS